MLGVSKSAVVASDQSKPLSATGWAIAIWGIGGVLLLLAQALYRLTPLAVEPLLDGSMTGWQWGLYVGWTLFNAYAEGYRGFQKAFAPRVVARAFYLARHPRPLFVAFAPLFCMALFYATRRRIVVSWVVVGLIVLAVALVKQLPQPWRGIVDAGVVVGLVWGVVAIMALFVPASARADGSEHDALPAPPSP